MSFPAPPSRWSALWAGVLVLLTLTAYGTVISNGGWIWDDNDYVTQNVCLRSGEGLVDIWTDTQATPQYYPLVHTSFWLEFQLWGTSPTGFHLVNILLHALSALVLWRLLLRLGVPGAWFAAAVFAIHPVHMESVAWITERKNVLSLLLSLLSASQFLRWSGMREGGSSGDWKPLALSVLCFVGALLSKTVVASLPAVLILILWWHRPDLIKRALAPLVGMLALGAAMGLRTAMLEVEQVGAKGADFAFSLADRFLIAGRALWFYAGKLVWPDPLVFVYPRWEIDDAAAWQYGFPAAAGLFVLVLFALKKRIGRGPLVGALIFGGVLFPALGFLNVYPMRFSFVADHFQYHASLGILVLLCAGAARLALPLRAKMAGAAVILGTFCWIDLDHGKAFKDEEALWETTLEANPSAWMAWHNLGVIQRRSGRLDQAMESYRRGLELDRDPKILQSIGELHMDVARRKGWDTRILARAEKNFLEAVELWPKYMWAHVGLGNFYILAPVRNLDKAIHHYESALANLPARNRSLFLKTESMVISVRNLSLAYRDRARSRARLGDGVGALSDLESALVHKPGFPPAALDLVWLRACHPDPAIRKPKRAINLGRNLLRATGSRDPLVFDALATALAATGDFSGAVGMARKGVEVAGGPGSRSMPPGLESRLAGFEKGKAFRSSTGLPD